jgi:hypothetical protein
VNITDALYLISAPVLFLAGGITENCATWAIRQRVLRGGRVLVRRSHFADELLPPAHRRGVRYWLARQVPHYAWADSDGYVWQYTVRDEWRAKWQQKSLLLAWLALWFYDGHVVAGDVEFGDRV